MWNSPKRDTPDVAYDQFEAEYQKTQDIKSALWRPVKWRVIWAFFLFFWYQASTFVAPIIQTQFIQWMFDPTANSWFGWVLLAILAVSILIGSLGNNHGTLQITRCGIWARNALMVAVYRKSFRLSPAARHQTSTGNVGNKERERKEKE
jgi:ABC-type multidrug transport system fused ATPase/permease subunit